MLMIKQQNNRETSQIQLAMTCHIMHRKYLTHSYKPVCTTASIRGFTKFGIKARWREVHSFWDN